MRAASGAADRNVSMTAFRRIPTPGSCSQDPDNRQRKSRNRFRQRVGGAGLCGIGGIGGRGNVRIFDRQAALRAIFGKGCGVDQFSRIRFDADIAASRRSLSARSEERSASRSGCSSSERFRLPRPGFFKNRVVDDLLVDHLFEL